MSDELIIYVDNREERSELPQYLKVLDETIIQKQLSNGDVIISYKQFTVGIECKRKADLGSSLFSGHLHDQLCRLYDHFDYPILILEGYEWHRDDEVNLNLKKGIDTLNLRIATYVTQDMLETVELIGHLIGLLKKNKLNVLRRPIMLEPSDDPRIPVLCALPHISKAMAYALLEKYDTISNALVHVDEWDEVPRITDKRVEKIKKVLNEEMIE